MRLPPRPLDAACLVGSGRVVPGDQWIRDRAASAFLGLTFEQLWWTEALDKLHERLWEQALTPGPVLARAVVCNEALRDVTLYVETWGRGVAGGEWGLPAVMRSGTPPPPCPAGGDLLAVPVADGNY